MKRDKENIIEKMKSKCFIYDIPVKIKSLRLRRYIRKVLTQIKVRCPSDFFVILDLVKEIVPLNARDLESGTLGEWKSGCGDPTDLTDPRTWSREQSPGSIALNERINEVAIVVATIAHELGHVCHRQKDDPEIIPHGLWASELVADKYAVKWGFGRQIATARKTRDKHHHGPSPGEEFEFRGKRYRVTQNFEIRELTNRKKLNGQRSTG